MEEREPGFHDSQETTKQVVRMVANTENLCEGSKLLVSVLTGFSAAEVPMHLVLQPQKPPVSQTEESGTFLPLFPLPGAVFPRSPNSSGSLLTFHLLRGSSPNPRVPRCLTPACLAFFFTLATNWNYIFTSNSVCMSLSISTEEGGGLREEGRAFNLIVHGCVTNTWHIVAHSVVVVIGLVCQAFPVSPSVQPGFLIAVANSLAEAVRGNGASTHASGIQSTMVVGVTWLEPWLHVVAACYRTHDSQL